MLNLLYIAHGSNDFADDMHFIGLHKFLKSFNVYFAVSDSAFGKPETIYDRHMEYGWKDNWIRCANLYKEVDYNIKYDICIIGQVWKENQALFLELKHLLSPDAKVILVDSTDDLGPQIPVTITGPYYYFKNNIVADFDRGPYIPFSCPYEIYEKENIEPIKYEINCQLGSTHGLRPITVQAVLSSAQRLGVEEKSLIGLFKGTDPIIGSSPRTPTKDYWNVLDQSRMIIHERGCGLDAFRFWEAMATGNFVLCSPHNLFRINNMPTTENIVFWNYYDDLDRIIEWILSIPEDQIIQMRKRVKQQVEEWHAPHRRLEKIFRVLEIPYIIS